MPKGTKPSLFQISRKAGSWETVFHSAARLGEKAQVLVTTILKMTMMQEETLTPEAKKIKAEIGKRSGLKLSIAKAHKTL